MGRLDEAQFTALLRGCPACGGAGLALHSYIDRKVSVMLGDPDDDGRWAYDGEKFIDGVYRARCTACGALAFDAPECPRCHAADGLARALPSTSRLAVPKRCACKSAELLVTALVPALVTTTGAGRPPPPTTTVALGEPGFHVTQIECTDCGEVTEPAGCPLCDAPGPLRDRP
jgi:ribosomal protein S27AE